MKKRSKNKLAEPAGVAAESPAGEVQYGSFGGDHSKGKQKSFVFVALILLVITGAVLYALTTNKKTYEQVAVSANDNITSGKLDQAQGDLQSFIGSTNDPQEKGKAMMQLGAVYMNKKDYTQAEKWYKDAETVMGGSTIASQQALALIYERQQKKQEAIAAWNKVIELAQKEDLQVNRSAARSIGDAKTYIKYLETGE